MSVMTEEEMDYQIELENLYSNRNDNAGNLYEFTESELSVHDKRIRADILNEVSAKMEEIISDKCAEYGVGCIEAYCDACGEFEDWIKEQKND